MVGTFQNLKTLDFWRQQVLEISYLQPITLSSSFLECIMSNFYFCVAPQKTKGIQGEIWDIIRKKKWLGANIMGHDCGENYSSDQKEHDSVKQTDQQAWLIVH